MSDSTRETTPATVPPRAARQAGEVRARRAWAEPAVWSERMLTALEEGVRGGKWFSLMDKVHAPRTLAAAWARVRANAGAAGVDRQTIDMFERDLAGNLARLGEELGRGTYQPRPVRRVWIPKPGSVKGRPLGIPTVRDRVVQTALRLVIEPIFERDFAEHSYGFRPGRSGKQALRQVQAGLDEGRTWVVDADLKSYFDTIPHERLMEEVRRKVADGGVLALLGACLKQAVMEGLAEWTPEDGTPQGAVISPLLANIYLDPLDRLMAGQGVRMVRYADDFVILCRSRQEAEAALEGVRAWTVQAGLTLHPDKTRIVDATQKDGFDFLGYHFERGYRWPRRKSLDQFKDSIREATRRNNGHSLQQVIKQVNERARGWFEYFKHSHWTTFGPLDQWIRMRLRSLLRRRQHKRGRGRGSDHQRWPNAFFASAGLFSLAAARKLAVESARR